MEIVRAKQRNLGKIMGLLDDCIEDMRRNGIEQWGSFYPTIEIIDADLLKGQMYAVTFGEAIAGIVVITEDQEAEYKDVEWESEEEPVLVVHRLAVRPVHQRKGVATKLMDFVEERAVKRGYKSIRLDTYSKNSRSISLFEKRDYTKTGEVFFANRGEPFYCYEKILYYQ